MPGCYYRPDDRKQVEAADYAKPVGTSLAVQRTEKGLGGNQPEGADGQSALYGGRRYHHPYCLSRSAAESGIRPFGTWGVNASDYQSNGNMGYGL